MSSKGMWMAFAVGAVAGGVTAILTAPDKGERTRKRVVDGTKNAVDTAKQAIEEKSNVLAGAAASQKDAVKEAVSTARDVYQERLEAANQTETGRRRV